MMKKNDPPMARAVTKTHCISDSEDSDSTVDPNSSQDLFDIVEKPSVSVSSATGVDKEKRKLHSCKAKPSSNSQLNPYDTDVEEEQIEPATKRKPSCKYGSKCYRKNSSHIEEFHHPQKRKHAENNEKSFVPEKLKKRTCDIKTPADVVEELQPFSFFLTKVADVATKYNNVGAMSLGDILSESMGKLKQSCHFNFMFDMKWMVQQYPEPFRKLPILLVHGEQGRDQINMKANATEFPQISLCRAPLEIPFGTHHTKMMFLLYDSGLRIVIHTANIIPSDWHQKTQGIWISPVFPSVSRHGEKGDSLTGFKSNLLQYLAAYRAPKLGQWERIIQAYDMANANVHLIGSVPGRHTLNQKHLWGHFKLRKVLSECGPDSGLVKHWPLVGQFSSIGSLGPTPDSWLLSEFGDSLSTCKTSLASSLPKSKVHLIFPSKDNVRLSLEGYNGGGCVPYSIKTASKQPWLTKFFCQWKSDGRGRSGAVPHIKSYTRFSPDGSQAAWFLVTSANLSKAAWGALEKKGSQLMIRSYELGVLFLPQYFGCKNGFRVTSRALQAKESDTPLFPLPYDLPPTTYVKGDRPWFCDVPCMDLPDTFGTMWCPPL